MVGQLLRSFATSGGGGSSTSPPLRVTLMSATLDAQLFADYFQRLLVGQTNHHVNTHSQPFKRSKGSSDWTSEVSMLQVPGKIFPVQEFYLEDVLLQLDLPLLTSFQVRRRQQGPPNSDPNESPELSARLLREAANQMSRQHHGHGGRHGGQGGQGNQLVTSVLEGPHCAGEEMSAALIAQVVMWLCLFDPVSKRREADQMANGANGDYPNSNGSGDSACGAVLVFLPGTQDIREVEQAIDECPQRKMLGLVVLPLHGSLSSEDQARVFERPPPGKRKVVLATNVAESSVTIDDVVYVVNSGKVKERRFDPSSGVSSLQSHWTSMASNKQRRGRAGRVREGLCVHLFLRSRQALLRPFVTPEMKRVPLDELCLTMTMLHPVKDPLLMRGRVSAVLKDALEPPDEVSVAASLSRLKGLGALDENEGLTPLGRSLAQLPLEPRLGKMLILGVALGVVEPALTLAACSATRDPFVRPLHSRAEADAAKLSLAGPAALSDHMVLVRAYEQWVMSRNNGIERQWCQQNFVSYSAMNTIHRTREQLRDTLRQCRIIDRPDPPSSMHNNISRQSSADSFSHNNNNNMRESRRVALLRAVIAGSLWPNVCLVAESERCVSKDGVNSQRTVLHSWDNMGLHPHPASTIRGCQSKKLTIAVYQTKMITSQLYIDGVTLVSPLTALLFGGPAQCYAPPQQQQQQQHAAHHHQRSYLPPHHNNHGPPSSAYGHNNSLPHNQHTHYNTQHGLVQEGWIATCCEATQARSLMRLRSGIDTLVADLVGVGGRGGGGGQAVSDEARHFVDAIGGLLEMEES
mmetsp:Transcript_13881/g.18459  ORF Transcript_13881/g.18459 Transcript_13881/m.18459 type:complete len:805 (-) Transcript_13881:709-3123(-)